MISSATDTVCLLENGIAERVGPQKFKIWFKDATRLTLVDGIVRVEVPNVFVGDWIERHFTRTIQETIRDIVGEDPVSACLEGSRQGRFPEARGAGDHHAPVLDLDGASVKRQQLSLVEEGAESRSEQE